jgi:hypothetical protein
MINVSHEKGQSDSIVVRAGSAAGRVFATGLSASGAQVVVIESDGIDNAPTLSAVHSTTTCKSPRRRN